MRIAHKILSLARLPIPTLPRNADRVGTLSARGAPSPKVIPNGATHLVIVSDDLNIITESPN